MAEHRLGTVLVKLRRLLGERPTESADASLLARFAANREEAAFAALVARHGAIVLAVCRRVLGDADADDAFQATFLVLARRAGSIRSPEALGNWLHGVAHRTALKARTAAARRRRRETQVPAMTLLRSNLVTVPAGVSERIAGPVEVFDLTVDGPHNYFAGGRTLHGLRGPDQRV